MAQFQVLIYWFCLNTDIFQSYKTRSIKSKLQNQCFNIFNWKMAHTDIVMCINVCGKPTWVIIPFAHLVIQKHKFPDEKKIFKKIHPLTLWLPFIFHIKNHVQFNEGIWALKKHLVTHRKEKRKGSLHLKLPGEGKHLNIAALTIIKWCSFTLHEHTITAAKEERAWARDAMGAGVCVYILREKLF